MKKLTLKELKSYSGRGYDVTKGEAIIVEDEIASELEATGYFNVEDAEEPVAEQPEETAAEEDAELGLDEEEPVAESAEEPEEKPAATSRRKK